MGAGTPLTYCGSTLPSRVRSTGAPSQTCRRLASRRSCLSDRVEGFRAFGHKERLMPGHKERLMPRAVRRVLRTGTTQMKESSAHP
ncbi:unnamed protein product [Ectocarpus fasciculatus]